VSAPGARVLVVDDEPNIRKLVSGVLGDEGFSCKGAADAEEARDLLSERAFDVVLLDINLPGTDGLTFLREERERNGFPPVIIMSGHGTIAMAVEATRLGAYDFIEKPIAADRLLLSIRNCLRESRLERENRELREISGAVREMIGSSPAVQRLREQIARAAPTEARVLITGENGTGKELVARALHEGSPRRNGPFIKVNCAAIPSELLESELFGHEKGAFTGASGTRRGKFELAQGGTLLLDEIGDMNPATQAKLLRVLEENEVERVGGEKSIPLDVRVLASTNQDLAGKIREGAFREDLFYRLNVIPVHVPPLRERSGDTGILAAHYLEHFCRSNGRPPKRLGDGARALLGSHEWPGNVREVKNLMERLVIMVDREEILPEDVRPLLERAPMEGEPTIPEEGRTLAEGLEEYERRWIRRVLGDSGGNIAEAARRLGLDRANLHRKIRRLGIRR
jgi:two-component system nitrogen regulation response regulator NtrX